MTSNLAVCTKNKHIENYGFDPQLIAEWNAFHKREMPPDQQAAF